MILIFCVSCVIKSNAQAVTFENGVAFSRINNILSFKQDYWWGVKFSYLEKKFFYLSSGIDFIRKGGTLFFSEDEAIITGEINNLYMSLNTMFYIKRKVKEQWCILGGCGPRFDILLLDSRQVSNNSIIGLKCSLGIQYEINKWLLELNMSYLPSFSDFYRDVRLKDKTFSLGVGVGYRFY